MEDLEPTCDARRCKRAVTHSQGSFGLCDDHEAAHVTGDPLPYEPSGGEGDLTYEPSGNDWW